MREVFAMLSCYLCRSLSGSKTGTLEKCENSEATDHAKIHYRQLTLVNFDGRNFTVDGVFRSCFPVDNPSINDSKSVPLHE